MKMPHYFVLGVIVALAVYVAYRKGLIKLPASVGG